VKETVTYVELTARAQLRPAAPVPGLILEPLERDSPLIPEILARVGAAHGWTSTSRTAEQWRVWFARAPRRTFGLLSFDGEPVGIVTYDPRPGDQVEILTFGLVPEFVGRGLGGYALTLASERAWDLLPTVTRVWLHTSSFDHPHALPNYHRRGFLTYAIEERERS
jgi:RimJ/RimL family protein N-acetyltransferase